MLLVNRITYFYTDLYINIEAQDLDVSWAPSLCNDYLLECLGRELGDSGYWLPPDEPSCCHPAINRLEITIPKALQTLQAVLWDWNHSLLPLGPPHGRTSGMQLFTQGKLDICEVVHKPKVQAPLVEALCLIKGVWAFCEFQCLFVSSVFC